MKRFLHTIDQISEWSGKTFSWLLIATMLIIGFEIFMRIFNNPQIWVFDFTLFTAGVVCMATKRNALGVLMGIELVLNGANVNFVVSHASEL